MIKSIFLLGAFFASAITTSPIIMHSMKPQALSQYAKRRASLERAEIDLILDQGKELALQTGLIQILAEGGTALFPHSSIIKCGDQSAAAAYASIMACQKTGKNQILVLGVLHSLSNQLLEARKRELAGDDLSSEPCRGIFGPDLPGEEILSLEFSLDNFLFLAQKTAERYGLQLPKLIVRYPNLVNGNPETLPGIADLKNLASDSIVVATADLCHHGLAYGQENALPLSEIGLEFAKNSIKDHLSYFSNQNYLLYRENCLKVKSDSKDVGQVLQYLLGPLIGKICDLRLVDVSDLFDNEPQPSWVAATLVGLEKVK